MILKKPDNYKLQIDASESWLLWFVELGKFSSKRADRNADLDESLRKLIEKDTWPLRSPLQTMNYL